MTVIPDDTSAEPGPERADLDALTADLDGIEAALGRLDDGSYWVDEVTGEPLDTELLAAHPLTRRNPS